MSPAIRALGPVERGSIDRLRDDRGTPRRRDQEEDQARSTDLDGDVPQHATQHGVVARGWREVARRRIDMLVASEHLGQPKSGDVAADRRLRDAIPTRRQEVRQLLLVLDVAASDDLENLLEPRAPWRARRSPKPARRRGSLHAGDYTDRPRRAAASSSSAATRPGAVPPMTSGRASAASTDRAARRSAGMAARCAKA